VPPRVVSDTGLPATVAEVVATGHIAARHSFWRRGRRADADGARRVAAALARVGMDTHRGTKIGALSAGQQQRVFIARALVTDSARLPQPAPGLSRPPAAFLSDAALSALYGPTVRLVHHQHG
jgi:zinc transport system ATP-binding protein